MESIPHLFSGAPAWIRAVVILAAGWVAVRLACAALARAMDRAKLDPTLTAFTRRTLSAALWLVLLAVVLGTLGFDVAGFIAGLSVTGFVLGFAAKDALANLAAGVLLMVYRPFGVGDTVSAGGVDGVVREITVTMTVLLTANEVVTVPNSKIWGGPIKNLTRRGEYPPAA